jgi:phospholipid-binding lipoprotein MlaA
MVNNGKKLALLALTALSLSLIGCAAVPRAERDPRDPWQRVNRVTFRFDMAVYDHIGTPVARTYVRIVPHPIRLGISNFFNNLDYPTVIVNDLLQWKLKDFALDTGRLVVNTTLGFGGLFDPAVHLGMPREDRDFGQTFGKWGVGPGPYLVLPFLGPSDVRDAIGLVPEEYTTPMHYVQNTWADWGTRGVGVVNTDAQLQPTISLLRKSMDPYAFARQAYLAQRRFMVKGPPTANSAEQQLKEFQSGGGN